MKVAHCAIDTSLNFTQANKLIRDLKPSTLVVPECYTQPPVSAPNLTDYVIENNHDRTLISYKWGEVINLPLKRKHSQIFIETGVAQKIVPVEVKPGISLSSITGTLNVKDNVHSIQVKKYFFTITYLLFCYKDLSSTVNKTNKHIKYEWGSLNVTDFVQKLTQEGISEPKVESHGNIVVIHLVSRKY